MYKIYTRDFHPQKLTLGITLVYIHKLVVRARQQDPVAQLVRALHRNRRAAGSIPARGPIVAIFRRTALG